ncbi:MAG: DEAD/DEAH box helicase [Solidesulfovibrio sp.]|uniref:DEAD/DEAH box helicase n=1 Tax=Solidesulfovibrio sp. TaxID=2910990 RepID=UPI0031584148
MNKAFEGWEIVSRRLVAYADEKRSQEKNGENAWVDRGQRACLRALAERLPRHGAMVADEVGMGKTRIAVVLARMVKESGGRVAILVPPGLGYQWRNELRMGTVEPPVFLRSLWQYLEAWNAGDKKGVPWFDQDIVLLSHLFCNWRLGVSSANWRLAMLPELFAQWRVLNGRSLPRNYHGHRFLEDEWVKNAAWSIAAAMKQLSPDATWRKHMDGVFHDLDDNWPELLSAGNYAQNATDCVHASLEKAVGLGFGCFDLVIIDEAHKGKHDDSCLSRLLEMIFQPQSGRRFSMTATPVDLDICQWALACERIKVNGQALAIGEMTQKYKSAVREVQQKASLPEVRQAYKNAATAFHQTMAPYLFRRSKTECESVRIFQQHTGLPSHAYRWEEAISIAHDALDEYWKQAICAVEALSVVVSQNDGDSNRIAKRVRLTLGNGHGIAALMDQIHADEEERGTGDFSPEADIEDKAGVEGKRLARAQWWMELLGRGFDCKDVLYRHPAIRAAVRAIEEATESGQKVLVFGRFVKPLKALVDLLNAREMLRSLRDGRLWPESGIREEQRAAVACACEQDDFGWSLDEVDNKLKDQYAELEKARGRFRRGIVAAIMDGLATTVQIDQRTKSLFKAFSKAVDQEKEEENKNGSLVFMSRALFEILNEPDKMPPPDQCFSAFTQVVEALSDKDEGDVDGDGQLDEEEAKQLWPDLLERLKEEYDRNEGGFARLMYGNTSPSSRRMIQVAFNRDQSFPKVLVAQSMVGREGLNLHEACRMVILLHPEWNPGVVEQQIGRVDRLGSRWEKEMHEAVAKGDSADAIPRIEIRPVIFKGTYDEHNWNVLQERWSDLRAQLHGVVIPESKTKGDTTMRVWADEVNGYAPDFSPESLFRDA